MCLGGISGEVKAMRRRVLFLFIIGVLGVSAGKGFCYQTGVCEAAGVAAVA